MPQRRQSFYPPRHRRIRSEQIRFAAQIIGGLTVTTLACFAASFRYDAFLAPAAFSLTFLLLASWSNAIGLYDTARYVRIVPYFERPVGEIDTYCAGMALAAQCTRLDRVAIERGVPSLSGFGFNDDLAGETLTWHSPNEGLRTAKSLLQTVQSDRDSIDEQANLRADLEKLTRAFERAVEQETRFCLLLLHGDATSGHEWSQRKGSAF